MPELVFLLADLETGELALHQEAGDAAMSGVRIGVGEDQIQPGFSGVGDPQLAAGDGIMVAMLGGSRRERKCIRA